MRNAKLFGLALLATSALSAPAFAGDIDFTLSGEAAAFNGDADYINDDKPDNELSGVFGVVRLGVEYTFGANAETSGPFVGVNYYTTLTDEIQSGSRFNGNVLSNWAVMSGYSGWEVNGGYDFGAIAIGGGYGKLEREIETFQACLEDSAVLNLGSSGFCGSLTLAQQREGIRSGEPDENEADSWRVFGRYDVSEHVSIGLSYQQADFAQSVQPLNVTNNAANNAAGNRTPHGPTSFAQDIGITSISLTLRY